MALIGDQRPRLEHIPKFVNKAAGEDAVALAQTAGLYLDDWQRYCLINMLARDEQDLWSASEVLLIVSRQNGKGSVYEARELFGLFAYPSDRLLIHTAHQHKTSSEHYMRMWTLLENTPDLMSMVGRHSSAYGREFIETKPKPTIILGPGGSHVRSMGRKRLIFIARCSASGRGFTADFIAYDEAMVLDPALIEASFPSLAARPNPQVCYAGSAGLKNSTQMAKVRRRGLAGSSEGLLYVEWSAEICDEYCDPGCVEHDDPGDERTVAKANPAYNIRVSPRFIARERDAFQGNETGWYRERLGVGQYPSDAAGWFVIPERWFNLAADKSPEPERVIRPVFALDVAPDRSAAAIAVAGLRGSDQRTGLQVVEHQAGTGWIAARVKQLQDKWKPVKWIVDKRAAAGSLITELEKAGIPVETMQASDVAHSSGLLFDAFRDDLIRHYGQSSLKTAVAGCDKRKLSESWAFDRVNSGVDISPLMAVAFAYWGFMNFGDDETYDAADSVYFDLDRVKQMYRAGLYGPEDIRRLHSRGILSDKDLGALADDGIVF